VLTHAPLSAAAQAYRELAAVIDARVR